MLPSLKPILDIQELDIKMIRLMRLKRQRQKELLQIDALRRELKEQYNVKETEVAEFDKQVSALEEKIAELNVKIKDLEGKQGLIKKVDEFNAMTQEITGIERSKITLEQEASNLIEKKNHEEEILQKIKESLSASDENSLELEGEIASSIGKINQEGNTLKSQRNKLSQIADEEILKIYERLLRNKKDRVIVPIENRTCSGCHIALTIQHENLVRKGENLVFCEHCSRIHYWQESEALSTTTVATKRRRRRTVSA